MVEEVDFRKVFFVIFRDLEYFVEYDFYCGYKCMKINKLEEGVIIFKNILYLLFVNVVGLEDEVVEVKKVIIVVVEYIFVMLIEFECRFFGILEVILVNFEFLKWNLEFVVYFIIFKIEVVYCQLVLFNVMIQLMCSKNYSSVLSFVNRIIFNGDVGGVLVKFLEVVSFFIFNM